ncbi:hypothetical protein [Streptomyces sp. NPDC003077]|uniref:hypothetical protein n=1 Tax=Streptomyces sp. NPDC003077 TaxID=3154443 RepID=UPI0033B4C775
MNDTFKGFIKTYLDIDVAYYPDLRLKETLHSCDDEFVDAVRSGFKDLLRSRSLSPYDWEGLTMIEFEDEDALYDYLNRMYAYLFLGSEDQPFPPE